MTSTLDVLDSDNVLNRGTVANDNTGDTLRSAGLKINNQFENVDSAMFNTSWAEWPAGVKETNSVLRYNGSKFVGTNNVKIDSDGNTTVSGTLSVTDSATFSGNVNLGDNDILNFGAGDDLQIYHDGSNSYIKEVGTGNLVLLSSNYSLKNAANNEQIISAVEDGAVELYYDNTKRIETTNVGGTITGSLVADSATISGNLTANTISLGASGTISGDLTVDGNIILSDSDDITLPDRSMIKLGTDSDFAIHFDSNNHAVIETTKVNTPLVFKHNNVEVMRLTDGEVNITGNLRVNEIVDFAAINYERVLAAYGSTPYNVDLTDGSNSNPAFLLDDTWDSVPVNTGVFNCTKNVTKIRDLIDGFVDSDRSSIYAYAVVLYGSFEASSSTSYGTAYIFGKVAVPEVYENGGLLGGDRFLIENGQDRQYSFLKEDIRPSEMLGDSNLGFITNNSSRRPQGGSLQTDIPLSNGDPINFGIEIFERKLRIVTIDDVVSNGLSQIKSN
jgi:cytoskeletal protein CcmA (bactofilin family)